MLSSSAKILKIREDLTSYREFKGGNFFETRVVVVLVLVDSSSSSRLVMVVVVVVVVVVAVASTQSNPIQYIVATLSKIGNTDKLHGLQQPNPLAVEQKADIRPSSLPSTDIPPGRVLVTTRY